MLANLEKARAAAKEKGYQSTEKRRAANLANLQKAQAARAPSAKPVAQAEQQEFTERFERLFPPFSPGDGSSVPEDGGRGVAAGAELLREAAEQVWKRRRFYPRRARREGRKVMRLLTAAARSPAPGSVAEAFHLLRQLLEIFLKSRAVRQAERLNQKIERLLLEMLEGRYGREVFLDGFPLATAMREIEANVKRLTAEAKAEREARRAARSTAVGAPLVDALQGSHGGAQQGSQGGAPHVSEADEAKVGEAKEAGEGEQGQPEPVPPAAETEPRAKPRGKAPELPEKFEDFLEIFSRAFPPPSPGRATAGNNVLLRSLASAVWERLHVYERQVRQEEAGLRCALDDLGTQAVETYKDLRERSYMIEIAFKTEPALSQTMARLAADIELGINQLLKWRYGSDLDQEEIFPPPPRPSY